MQSTVTDPHYEPQKRCQLVASSPASQHGWPGSVRGNRWCLSAGVTTQCSPTPFLTGGAQVPEQPWFMNPLFSAMISGVLPFGAVFTELSDRLRV